MQVVIWDDGKNKPAIQLDFKTSVCGVRLSRKRIVVALLDSVHIFSFTMPPQKLSAFETAKNPLGLCCLGSKILAFPGRTPGQVQVVQIESENVSIIPAHGSPLRAIELSPDGEVLATASTTVRLTRCQSEASYSNILYRAPLSESLQPIAALELQNSGEVSIPPKYSLYPFLQTVNSSQ